MILLGKPKRSGGVPVTDKEKATLLTRIPDEACQPAHVCVRNSGFLADGSTAGGIVYIKTIGTADGGGKVSATDYGILLNPGEAYDWGGCPPRGCDVIAKSSVDGTIVSVEGNWQMLENPV